MFNLFGQFTMGILVLGTKLVTKQQRRLRHIILYPNKTIRVKSCWLNQTKTKETQCSILSHYDRSTHRRCRHRPSSYEWSTRNRSDVGCYRARMRSDSNTFDLLDLLSEYMHTYTNTHIERHSTQNTEKTTWKSSIRIAHSDTFNRRNIVRKNQKPTTATERYRLILTWIDVISIAFNAAIASLCFDVHSVRGKRTHLFVLVRIENGRRQRWREEKKTNSFHTASPA